MIKKLAGTLLPQALLAFGAPAAQTARLSHSTSAKNVNFNTGEVGFTATGALCPSGMFSGHARDLRGSRRRPGSMCSSYHLHLRQRRHLLRPEARAHCDQR